MRRKAFSKFSAVIIVPPPGKEGTRKRRGVGGGGRSVTRPEASGREEGGMYRGHHVLFIFVEVMRRLNPSEGIWFHASGEKRRSSCGGVRGKALVGGF